MGVATAVQDWEFMVSHAAKAGPDDHKDLFVMSSKNGLSHRMMQENGVIEERWKESCIPEMAWNTGTYLPGGQRRDVNWEEKLRQSEELRKRSTKAQWERFGMAMFGGLALIGPMLLMVLHRDRTTALATTSGSVFLFAIIVSRFTLASPDVAVAAVAAYAAVLVTFVGSSLPQTT